MQFIAVFGYYWGLTSSVVLVFLLLQLPLLQEQALHQVPLLPRCTWLVIVSLCMPLFCGARPFLSCRGPFGPPAVRLIAATRMHSSRTTSRCCPVPLPRAPFLQMGMCFVGGLIQLHCWWRLPGSIRRQTGHNARVCASRRLGLFLASLRVDTCVRVRAVVSLYSKTVFVRCSPRVDQSAVHVVASVLHSPIHPTCTLHADSSSPGCLAPPFPRARRWQAAHL